MIKSHHLIYENFYQHCRMVTSQVPGMKVFNTESLSISDCTISSDTFNIICLRHPEKLTLAELLNAREYFEKQLLAYTIWAEESQLSAVVKQLFDDASVYVTNREPGMLLHLQEFSPVYTDMFQHIRKASTPEEVHQYAQIVARNWQIPDQHLINYYIKATPVLLSKNSPAGLYLYYLADKPVAAVELFAADHQTAGIFNLSTLEENRGCGIGTALISYALNQAKCQEYVFATLQASEDGIGIYKKLGFATKTIFSEWHG